MVDRRMCACVRRAANSSIGHLSLDKQLLTIQYRCRRLGYRRVLFTTRQPTRERDRQREREREATK